MSIEMPYIYCCGFKQHGRTVCQWCGRSQFKNLPSRCLPLSSVTLPRTGNGLGAFYSHKLECDKFAEMLGWLP